MNSIKRPRAYHALKARGYSKSKAARISNAGRTHAARSRMARKAARTRRRHGRGWAAGAAAGADGRAGGDAGRVGDPVGVDLPGCLGRPACVGCGPGVAGSAEGDPCGRVAAV